MKSKQKNLIVGIAIIAAFAAFGISRLEPGMDAGKEHDEHGEAGHNNDENRQDEINKGPHGGKLFTADSDAVELSIYETGVPPEFRLYGYRNGKPVEPAKLSAVVTVTRIGGRKQVFNFKPEANYLLGDAVVEEPHSFDVAIEATIDGRKLVGSYQQREGRVSLTQRMREAAGIAIETVQMRPLQAKLRLPAVIAYNGDRVAHVFPRYAGVVRQVDVHLGERVKRGDKLATIESNQTLTRYDLRAELDGIVVEKHIVLSESVSDRDEVFLLADLRTVWAELQIPAALAVGVSEGMTVEVSLDGIGSRRGKIAHVSPRVDEATQAVEAHAVLDNSDGKLRPGAYAVADLFLSAAKPVLAVRRQALQTFRDWTVVFVNYGDDFEIQPIEVGAGDDEWVEVLSGLEAGQSYAAGNSYVLKADILKAGASHDH